MAKDPIVVIYCPDCRGKFSVYESDIIEEDILECELCGAEIEVVSADPIKLKLYSEEDEF